MAAEEKVQSIREQFRIGEKELSTSLGAMKAERDQLDRSIWAMELALKYLKLSPDTRTFTNITLDLTPPFVGKVELGRCSECEEYIQGYEQGKTHFCASCGSKIKSVKREHDPTERYEEKIRAKVGK